MAENINLRLEEYQTITTELSSMHTTQLENINDAINAIKITLENKNVFSVENTSQKIIDMLDLLSSEVVTLLEQAFIDSEAGLTNMVASTVTTDTTYN